MNTADLITYPGIETRILLIRGKQVMIDSDLADLYEVSTKRLNEQVKRNSSRFPEDFIIELTPEETKELVANCDRFANLKHSTVQPKAFTEHGVLMLSNVLKSEKAVDVSVQIVRAFVRIRSALLANPDLAKKVADIEIKLSGLQTQLDIFQGLVLPLLNLIPDSKHKIGFKKDDNQ